MTTTSAVAAFPAAEWLCEAPASQGLDPGRLGAAIAFLQEKAGADGVEELVLVRRGRLLWRGPRADIRHGVWSVTKSFTSTALGLLVDDGKAGLDTLAGHCLPELAATYPALTLRHFATMTSGYRAAGDEPRGQYRHGPSATPFLPDPTPLFAPGAMYAYWDSAMNQFGNALTRIAGEPLRELLQRRIGDTIGLARDRWLWGDFGVQDGHVVNGGAGNLGRNVQICALDLARLGLLFLHRGVWQGKRLISARWVEQATSVQVPAGLPLHERSARFDGRGVYGLNWWVNGRRPDGGRKWPGAPAGAYAAVGANNNFLFVVPEWEMVIVRLGLDGASSEIADAAWGAFLAQIGEALSARPAG